MNTNARRALLALASILAVVVLRCSGSDTVTGIETTRPTPVPTAPPTPTPIPEGLTGTWVGTVKYSPAEYCSSPDSGVSAEFVQHGSTVTATLRGACWPNARFEGSRSGPTLIGRISFGDYCDPQRQTRGELPSDSEIHLSVTGFRGEFCSVGGSVVLHRR